MGGVRSFIEHYLEYYERSLYVYGHDACMQVYCGEIYFELLCTVCRVGGSHAKHDVLYVKIT
jgi:hypothetical protein